MSESTWDGIKSFISGYSSGVAETMERFGGKIGGNVGAMKDLALNLTTAIADYNRDPSDDKLQKIEQQAVEMLTGMLGAEFLSALGLAVGGPVGAIAGAAIGAAAASLLGDEAYEIYRRLKQKGFETLEWYDNQLNKIVIPSRLYDGFDNAKQLFYTAEAATPPTPPSCPIVLDLDGDGVETTSVNAGGYFDHDGNGFAEQTGLAASDDGTLVMDRNNDGIINDGKELFGNETLLADGTKAANGFQALADLDSNADGKIDINDTAFAQLKVWQDIDGDGYSASDELKTLSDLGIQSINTGYVDSTTIDANGNEQVQAGTFEKILVGGAI
jgi:hypothetical protein